MHLAKLPCFEFVFHTLSRAQGGLPLELDQARAQVARAFRRMTEHYHHNVTLGAPDYSDEITRFAYTCKYVPAHAHWLYLTLAATAEIRSLIQRPHIKVVVLGGGPGSELLGFVKFLVEHGHSLAITCDIIDRCALWAGSWKLLHSGLLQRGLVENGQVNVDYHAQDFNCMFTPETQQKLNEADLVLSSFLLSEMRASDASIGNFLRRAFASIKPGAVVVLNDNLKGRALADVDQAAEGSGLETRFGRSRSTNVHPTDEVEAAYADFWKKLDHHPKCKGELGARVYAKPLVNAPAARLLPCA